MPAEDDPKEFPDVSHKLSAPKKLSAFEKERQAAEEKRRRAEAENAAALKDFEDSFGGEEEEEDKYDGFPRFNAPPSGPRGGFGGPPGRYGGAPSRSGQGNLGPGGAPPSLKRKRALDEMREAHEARREQEALVDEYPKARSANREDSYASAHEDDREDRELRRFIANALTAEMMNSIPGGTNSDRAKTPVDVPESERQISWNNQQEGS